MKYAFTDVLYSLCHLRLWQVKDGALREKTYEVSGEAAEGSAGVFSGGARGSAPDKKTKKMTIKLRK